MAAERDQSVPLSQISSARRGAVVTLRDKQNREYRGRILRIEDDAAVVRVFENLRLQSESNLQLTLVQALPERERMALILQKATELGVHRFVPCVSTRSADPTVSTKEQDKSHRWDRVVQKAVQQCRRRVVPEIAPIASFPEVVRSFSDNGALKLILYEKEEALRLKDVAAATERPISLILVCGPQGGFTEEEVRLAQENGFTSLRLGGRILRCETAAIAAVSIVQHVWGDL